MNEAQIVRWDADSQGARFRLWIDDEHGSHVAVAEFQASRAEVLAWLNAIERANNKEAQDRLFDA